MNYVIILELKKELENTDFINAEEIVNTAKIEHAKSSNKELFEQFDLNGNVNVTVIEGTITPAVKVYLNKVNEFFATYVINYTEEEQKDSDND